MGKNEFERNVAIKSFINVGDSMVDLKSAVGYSFANDPKGYLFVYFVYFGGTIMTTTLANRDEFYHFMLQMEQFVDRLYITLPSIQNFINKIELRYKGTTDWDKDKDQLFEKPTTDDFPSENDEHIND